MNIKRKVDHEVRNNISGNKIYDVNNFSYITIPGNNMIVMEYVISRISEFIKLLFECLCEFFSLQK